MLDLFSAKYNPSKSIVYYTENNQLTLLPFFKLDENKYLSIYLKQYLEAVIYKLQDIIIEKKKKNEYLKSRDFYVESKTAECLFDFFTTNAEIYKNYGLNNFDYEQDILIIYKSIAIIIEVKAGSYRAPMRDPTKAYAKIKSDFKSIIYNGLKQANRVSHYLEGNEILKIIASNNSLLGTIDCSNITRNYSIVLTKERFGHIQSNLKDLIPNLDEFNRPLSMCFEDFEVILLILKQTTNPIQNLINYLDSRPLYHGHLICSDEMELFGYFLENQEDYFKNAFSKDSLVTHIDNTNIIDEIYSNGMGFKNEINLENKKDKNVGILFKKGHNTI